jgi:3-oxoacyl-[acyl-carrier protein] reductase
MRMNIDLSNRTALVTGATGELGRVISRTLASCGARVAIHYHRAADRAEALQRELPGSVSFQADITVKADVDRMRDAVRAELGAPDIIVTNAVIQYQWTKVLEQSPTTTARNSRAAFCRTCSWRRLSSPT